MRGRVINLMVHAIDDIRGGAIFDGGGDNDLFNACGEIGRKGRSCFKFPRAVNDHIHPLKGQVMDVFGANKRNALVIYDDSIFSC